MHAKHVVHEADHRPDDFRRRVVRAGELTQRVVVNRQEVLVEVEPGVGISLADGVPVHGVKHADQGAKRRFQGCLVADFVGEQTQGRADERVGLAELLADLVEPVGETDVARPGHQQAERDGLRIAVGELFVVRFGEEELPPIGGERGQGRAFLGQLLGDFVAEQAAEPGRDPGQFRGGLRRDRLPAKEVVEPRDEFERCRELVSRRFNVALLT